MTKKFLALISVIFIIMLLPIGTFATSDTTLNDSIIVTEMKFLTDDEAVLDNVTSETKAVRLECTNLYPDTACNTTITVTAKNKVTKELLNLEKQDENFDIGDAKRIVDIDFDLSDIDVDFENIDISFYIWTNASLSPLSTDLTVDSTTNLNDNTFLYENYNIYKLSGIIEANSKIAYFGQNKTDVGYVAINVQNDYDCPDSSLDIEAVAGRDSYTRVFSVGKTIAEDLIGNNVVFYVKQTSEGRYEIVAIEPDDLYESLSFKINASDLNDDELYWDDSYRPTIRYYKEGSTSGSGTRVPLELNFEAIWNNSYTSAAHLASNLNSSVPATIEFIDWDNDGYYDVVKVIEYAHLIAKNVDIEKGIIETYQGIKVDLDIANEDANVSIKDINSYAMQLNEIENGDVLALIVHSDSSPRASLNLVKTANYDSLEITVLKNNFIEGKVTEYDSTLSSDGYYISNITIAIDGIKYDVNLFDSGIYNDNKIDLQAEGTFYLDIYGKIVGFEGLYETPNYGLIMSAYTSTNKSVAPLLTVLTKDGSEVTYDVASSLRIVNPNTGKYTKVATKDALTTEDLAYIAGSTWNGVVGVNGTGGASDTLRNELYAAFGAELDEVATTSQAAEVKARLVTYKLNANNEISEITPAVAGTADEDTVELGFEATTGKVAYNENGQKLGKYLLADDAVVFDIDFLNPEKSKVYDISYFIDDSEYEALLYSKDEDGYYGAAVILASDAVFKEGAGIAVVKSVSSILNENEDTVTKVVAYKDGAEVELIFDKEEYTEIYSNVNPEEFAFGTVLMYNAYSDGIVFKYVVVGQTTVTSSAKTFVFDDNFKELYTYSADATDGDAFYLGWIYNKTSNNANIELEITDSVIGYNDMPPSGELFTVANANQYTITGTTQYPSITTGTYTDGNVDEAYYDTYGNIIGYYALIRTYEEEVVDIISFDDKGQIINTDLEIKNDTDTDTEKEFNYGLIMSAYTSTNKSIAPQITMLTKEGNQVTYDVASSLKIVNPNTSTYTEVSTDNVMTTDDLSYIASTTWNGIIDNSDPLRNELYEAFGAELGEIAIANRATAVQARLVTYKLNADNEISEITPAVAGTADIDEVELGFNQTNGTVAYNENGQRLGKYLLDDDAAVFDIDFLNPEKSKVYDVSYFVNDGEYEALLYSKNNDLYYQAAVIIASNIVFEEGTGVAIVKSVSYILNENEDAVVKVVAYKDGAEVELIFDEEEYTEVYSKVNPQEFAFGTVLMYNAYSDGIVSKYVVVGQTTVTSSTKTFAFNEDFKENYLADISDGDAFYLGWIESKTSNNNNVYVQVTDAVAGSYYTNSQELFTVANANQYTITGTARNPSITAGTYTDGNVDVAEYYYDYYDEYVIGYYVLIRTFEEEVIDIISFDDKGQTIYIENFETGDTDTDTDIDTGIGEETAGEEEIIVEGATEKTVEEDYGEEPVY